LNPADASQLPEYFFSVAPRSIDITDPFSTQIVPTQRGGKFVESHGAIIKKVKISGTTGVRPRRGRVGNKLQTTKVENTPLVGTAINDITGQAKVFLDSTQRGIPTGEQTGFDDILFLRNIFRAYSDYRENGLPSNNIVMVWYNAKEGDSWVVEPRDFRVSRTSKSPLGYTYNIQFDTLAPLTGILNVEKDPLTAILATRKVFSRVQEFNQSLRRTFLIVSTQIRRLEGLGVFAQTQILDPIINVTRGLGVIRATGATFGIRLAANARLLASELDEAIDLLTGTPGVEEQDALVRSLRRARITAARILVEPGVRETVNNTSIDKQARYTAAYITGGDSITRARNAPDTGGSSTFVGNLDITANVGQDFVHLNEDIRACAGRLMGDKRKWKALVTVNSLQAPYISVNGEAGTLAPGDPILYPSLNASINSATLNPVNRTDNESSGKSTNTLGPVQQTYGRDLRLRSVPTSAVGVDLSDLKINQNGDIGSVVGIPNVEQALIVKFSTERGEIPAHPSFGASFPIGSKATISSINDFRIDTISTITSDSRIRDIIRLDFLTYGDVLVVNTNLTLKNATDSLNTSIALRSF